MELTHIFVDFENVQPQDLLLLFGHQYRVKVFHGPHQNKLDVAIVKALQPLGEQVEYIQSNKAGKNALDFHIAFWIGRALQMQELVGRGARFVVVSKDGGFDSLLCHVRSLGYAARQTATNRPAKRVTLERHILALLGGKTTSTAVQAVIAELERRGVVEFDDKQIKYKLPKLKK